MKKLLFISSIIGICGFIATCLSSSVSAQDTVSNNMTYNDLMHEQRLLEEEMYRKNVVLRLSHPHAPDSVIKKYIGSKDPKQLDFVLAIARRDSLRLNYQQRLANHTNPVVRAEIASRTGDAQLQKQFVRDEDVVCVGLAKNPFLLEVLKHTFAVDPRVDVRIALASNPSIGVIVATKLAGDVLEVKQALASNKAAHLLAVRDTLLLSGNMGIVQTLLQDRSVSSLGMDKLLRRSDMLTHLIVQRSLLSWDSVPFWYVDSLLMSGTLHALANPAIPIARLHIQINKDTDNRILRAIATRNDLDTKLVNRVMQDTLSYATVLQRAYLSKQVFDQIFDYALRGNQKLLTLCVASPFLTQEQAMQVVDAFYASTAKIDKLLSEQKHASSPDEKKKLWEQRKLVVKYDPSILARLMERCDEFPRVMKLIVDRPPNTHFMVLASIAEHTRDVKIMSLLSNDDFFQVRAGVAKNKNIPFAIQKYLAKSDNTYVIQALLSNPVIDTWVIADIQP